MPGLTQRAFGSYLTLLKCARDFVVFAVDVGDESGQNAARRAAPKAVVRRLRAAKLL
jgi:hypothetical protein